VILKDQLHRHRRPRVRPLTSGECLDDAQAKFVTESIERIRLAGVYLPAEEKEDAKAR
jgi:exonuclease III